MARLPHHPGNLPALEAPSVAVFFDQLCPEVLARRSDWAKQVGGRIAFQVHGAGAWTLDLGRAQVDPWAHPDADLTVQLGRDALEEALKGKVSVLDVLVSGAGVKRALAERLSVLFSG